MLFSFGLIPEITIERHENQNTDKESENAYKIQVHGKRRFFTLQNCFVPSSQHQLHYRILPDIFRRKLRPTDDHNRVKVTLSQYREDYLTSRSDPVSCPELPIPVLFMIRVTCAL